MKANQHLYSDTSGNIGQVATGAIMTLIVVGVLGIVGMAIMDGVSTSSTIADDTYSYSGAGVTGNQTVNIADGVVSSATITITNNNGTSDTFTLDIGGDSDSRTTDTSATWTLTPGIDATELILDTDSTDYSYSITSSIVSTVEEYSSFYDAQENFIEGIDGSMGMTGTMAIVIVSISVIFLVMRLVQ